MRVNRRWVAVLGAGCAVSAAAVTLSRAQPVQWDVHGRSRGLMCGTLPLLLTGDRQDLTVTGSCRYVRVAGRHNDISIDIVPGGMIEITGSHNDVTWHALPGQLPHLLDRGASNDFHRG